MDEKAYWISPEGEILPVGTSHVREVIGNPGRFGITREQIEEAYKKYREPLGLEGRAREEIIRTIINKGWIRIRDYGQYLSAQAYSMEDHDAGWRLSRFFSSVRWKHAAQTEVRLGLLKQNTVRVMSLEVLQRMVSDDQ